MHLHCKSTHRAGNDDFAVFEGLAERFQRGAGELRHLIQEEDAAMREGKLAGTRDAAAAGESRRGERVVRGTERPDAENGPLRNEEAGDGFDSEDQSIVLNSSMSTEEVEAVLEQLQPGSGAFAAMFSGMTFMLPAGSGHIEVDFLTMGDRVINVKIGDQATAKFSQSAKGTVSIDYYCIEDTYVYIFGSAEASDARPVNYASVFRARAPRKASANADAVKIYGYTVAPEETITGIRSIENEQLTKENWYDLSGRKLNGKPTAKGIYILSGKVVVVK